MKLNGAQILANRVGVPVEKVEAIIIQMALQFAQAQGRAITGQYIFQLANQIMQYPNGVLAQAILQLVKQDDGGKSSHTTTIIKNYVKIGRGDGGDGKRPPKCDSGYQWDKKLDKCVPYPPPPDCKKDPKAEGCEPAPDPCIDNPNAEGCQTQKPISKLGRLPDDGTTPPPPPDDDDTDTGDTDTGGGTGGSGGGGGDSGSSEASGDSSSAGDTAK